MTLEALLRSRGLVPANGGLRRKVHCPFHGADRHPSALLNPNNIYCWVCNRSYGLRYFEEAFGITLDRVEEGSSSSLIDNHGYSPGEVLFSQDVWD